MHIFCKLQDVTFLESVIIAKTDQMAKKKKKIETGAHTNYIVILKCSLFKEIKDGKNRPLKNTEPILFYSANSKGNIIENFHFFFPIQNCHGFFKINAYFKLQSLMM